VFNFADYLGGASEASRSLLFSVILLWSVFWKGLALWNSARKNQRVWFVVALVVNTVGVLEIIYLAFFKKDKNKKGSKKK
jgi:methionyl-tRNA synthetase